MGQLRFFNDVHATLGNPETDPEVLFSPRLPCVERDDRLDKSGLSILKITVDAKNARINVKDSDVIHKASYLAVTTLLQKYVTPTELLRNTKNVLKTLESYLALKSFDISVGLSS